MHFLDGLVGEDLALDTTKSYLRQAVYIDRTVTKDLNKSASIGSFQERNEKKNLVSHTHFGFSAPSERKLYVMKKSHNYLIHVKSFSVFKKNSKILLNSDQL